MRPQNLYCVCVRVLIISYDLAVKPVVQFSLPLLSLLGARGDPNTCEWLLFRVVADLAAGQRIGCHAKLFFLDWYPRWSRLSSLMEMLEMLSFRPRYLGSLALCTYRPVQVPDRVSFLKICLLKWLSWTCYGGNAPQIVVSSAMMAVQSGGDFRTLCLPSLPSPLLSNLITVYAKLAGTA